MAVKYKGKAWRRRCPVCKRMAAMRKQQKTCSVACAGLYRAQHEDKARRRDITRKAGKASARARTARIVASLEQRCAGKSLPEIWIEAYKVGYAAGWYRGAHDRPARLDRYI